MGSSGCPYPLPPEITDQVIDHLHNDHRSLGACSLVCRAWFAASRYHLFREVNLSGKNSKGLSALLGGSNPLASAGIHTINIHEVASNIYSVSRTLDKTLPTISSSLPKLHTLRLMNINFALLSRPTQIAFATGFESIKSLHVNSVTFGYFKDFTNLIAGHIYLDELHLSRIWWDIDEANSDELASETDVFSAKGGARYVQFSSAASCRLVLKDIAIDITKWLASSRFPLTVRHLDFSSSTGSDLHLLQELLFRVGHRLHTLIVGLPALTYSLLGSQDLQTPSLLSYAPNLLHLAFSGIVLIPPLTGSYKWMTKLLQPPPSNSLETVSFYFICNQLRAFEQFNSEDIMSALNSSKFPRLDRINFIFKGSVDHEQCRRHVEGLSTLFTGTLVVTP